MEENLHTIAKSIAAKQKISLECVLERAFVAWLAPEWRTGKDWARYIGVKGTR